MPYAPGTILFSLDGSGNYVYRVVDSFVDSRDHLTYNLVVVEADHPAVHAPGDTVSRTASHLANFGYAPEDTSPTSDSREEVKMKIHNLIHNSPDVATPVSAVTMPEGTYGGTTIASRRFDGRAWLVENDPNWTLDEEWPVLIEFSDGTLGVTAESHLGAALATFDLQLVTS